MTGQPGKSFSLSEQEAHVFLCRPHWVDDPMLLEEYRSLLDAEECSRLERFRFEEIRRNFLISHALVRCALSLYDAKIPPEAWLLRANPFGRPEIIGPVGAPPLRFNLSHTSGLAACVVTRTLDAGVDAEAERTFEDILTLAANTFAPREVAVLRALPSHVWVRHFLSLWTLKESYAKARGMGLSLPLDRFEFRIDRNRINVHFGPEIADRAEDWCFTLTQPTPAHWLAVAVRAEKSLAQTIRQHWFLPLRGIHPSEPCPMIVAATEPRPQD